jgi:hypothetical protein
MSNALVIGSPEHKALFCRSFLDTHDPFQPSEIRWPDLDAEGLGRLKAMPIWNEATRTEAATAVKVQSLGDTEKDPVLAEAIRLQGYEEARHAEVLQLLTRHYGIEVTPFPAPEVPRDPTRAFLRTGYGECLDSFFAFGLFRLGAQARFFPEAFIAIFETWRAWNVAAQALDRLKGALQMAGGDGKKSQKKTASTPDGRDETQVGFTLKAHAVFGDFSLRSFLETCLVENDRRLAPYDSRLLRPMLVPSVVRQVVKVLPRKSSPNPPTPEEKAA